MEIERETYAEELLSISAGSYWKVRLTIMFMDFVLRIVPICLHYCNTYTYYMTVIGVVSKMGFSPDNV